MSDTKEEQAKRRWLAIQEELDPGETEIERTLSNIATVKAGWHRVRGRSRNPKPGDPEFGFAYFPHVPVLQGAEQRAAEDRWAARALLMHAEQTPVTLAPKPRENTLAGRVMRAD